MTPDTVSPILVALLIFWQICKSGGRDSTLVDYTRDVPYYMQEIVDVDHPLWDNGALSLILSSLADRAVDALQEELARPDTVERLSEAQARRLRHKLKGLYADLKHHPALMERRLFVGSQRPSLPKHQMSKRTRSLDIAQPVCPSRTDWQLLRRARDINDTVVEVFQPESRASTTGQQWFYVVRCNNHAFRGRRDCPGCCIGIAHDRYDSMCSERMTMVWAVARRPSHLKFDWLPIQVRVLLPAAPHLCYGFSPPAPQPGIRLELDSGRHELYLRHHASGFAPRAPEITSRDVSRGTPQTCRSLPTRPQDDVTQRKTTRRSLVGMETDEAETAGQVK